MNKLQTLSEFVPKRQSQSLIPLFAVISLLLNALVLLFLMGLSVAVWRLALRPLPQMVQLEGGSTLSVRPAPYYHREPAVIKDFVGQIFSLFFTWSQWVEVEDEAGKVVRQVDRGVVLASDSDVLVPTSAYEAGYALTESLRLPYLNKLGQMVPSGVRTGAVHSALKIDYLGEPEEIEPGKWKLHLVSNLIVSSALGEQRVIPVNKTVYVEAVYTPPSLPVADSPSSRAVRQIRSAQLQIAQIEDFDPKELTHDFITR